MAGQSERPFIPVGRPDLGQAEIDEVVDTLRSGWLTTGPKVARFERALAEATGAPEVVALSSCTAALHLALHAAGVGPGDEVVVPALTFASAVNVVEHLRAVPVLADVDPDTLNVTAETVAARITDRTQAIQVLHHGGLPCDLDGISAVAARHGCVVVEDAAHALGASHRGRAIGSVSPFTAFSFYAVKNVTTGEGGALAITDSSLAARLRAASLHGLSRDAWARHAPGASWRYDVRFPGFKCNMTDIQASLGIHQLAKLGAAQHRRAAIVGRYRELLAGSDAIRWLATPTDRTHAHHLAVVRVLREASARGRDELADALNAERIGTTVHYTPIYRFTHYREKHDPAEYSGCEAVADQILTLPLYPSMSDADVERVAEAVDRLTPGLSDSARGGFYTRAMLVDWNAVALATSHRPWPPPHRSWVLSMSWVDLLFAHWRVDAGRLRATLPPGLELDTFDGDAWLGVVPFRMENVGPRGLPPVPGLSAFPELNVRTYVRAVDGRPGVWFLSLDADSTLAVRAARLVFHLPYYDAAMRCERAGDWIESASRRTDGRLDPGELVGRYRPDGAPLPAEPGTIEHWLTERYCLYSYDGQSPWRGEIQHRAWPLQPATAELATCTVARAHGFELASPPELLHFAERLDVVAWSLDPVG